MSNPGKQSCPVAENMWLVRRIARRYQGSVGGAVSPEDLIQAGAIGLMRAAARYNPELCPTLAGYARRRVERAIQRCLNEHRRTVAVPVAEQHAAWRAGKPYPRRSVSLDAPSLPGDDGSPPRVELLTDGADPTGELDRARRRRRIAAALGRLPERSRHVLVARFYGDASLTEVGKAMAISRERVRQLEARALGQLRKTLEASP